MGESIVVDEEKERNEEMKEMWVLISVATSSIHIPLAVLKSEVGL